MKKNGFTLVELLAVIIILSIVAVVAVPRLVTSIKINNEDSYNGVIENIILAANSYANNQGGVLVQISVPYLQEKGYLPRNITSPIDNSIMSGCVYVVDGTSIYSEETCSTYLKGIEPSRMVTNACTYQNGYTWDFEYTGIGQEFIVPCDGTYKLEVWGAQGGSLSNLAGGKGGYSSGNISLTSGGNLYIYVGQEGKTYTAGSSGNDQNYGAFPNGGAIRWIYSTSDTIPINTGGGSTHVAKSNKTIAELGTNNSDLLIVAGGGGGVANYWSISAQGGYGGGASGGSTTSNHSNTNATGGTQSAAGQGGGNQDGHARTGTYLAGAFGIGGGTTAWGSSSARSVSGGGGGGYYGGGASWGGSGGGGSGYIGGVTDGTSIAGNAAMPTHDGTSTMTGNTGNGYARITLVESSAYANTHPYELGHTWAFDYTGGVQEFLVPDNGTYKLEVWGAQGGDYTLGTGALGGKGGYSTGNVSLSESDTIYIVVGGQGTSPEFSDQTASGGYNGGGIGSNVLDYSTYKWQIGGAGGGGASHIALTNLGELFNYNSKINELFLIAAGGGGAGANSGSSALQYNVGGYGGGTTGGNGTNVMKTNYSGFDTGRGGTQTAAGCSGTTSNGCGAFGKGGNNNTTSSASQGAGGGAGYFGGGAGRNYGTSGGGGSSWIDGVIDGSIIAGNAAMPTHDGESTMIGNSGNGYAKITLISY